jgi:hypothetical protein
MVVIPCRNWGWSVKPVSTDNVSSNLTTPTVIVAQMVRVLDCGSRGHGFESHLSPIMPSSLIGRTSEFESDRLRFESSGGNLTF